MEKRKEKLLIMFGLSTVFFLAEVIVGYMVNSVALIADSFHMLSDLLSMGVAFYSIKLAKRNIWTSKYTYGWQRAEVVGSLANGCFLLALCFTIVIEAIQRFFRSEPIDNPVLILIVGGLGMTVNVLGLLLFKEHSHSHASKIDADSEPLSGSSEDSVPQHVRNLNMHGVYLHILGDTLGSVAVIASSLFIWLTDFSWKHYIDPVISIFISAIIVLSTVGLVKSASSILLQAVPTNIQIDILRTKLEKTAGVTGVHDFHVWQLSDVKVVASVHLVCALSSDYASISSKVKEVLHAGGIHSTTVQLEQTFMDTHKDRMTEATLDHQEECLSKCENDMCLKLRCCPKGITVYRSNSGDNALDITGYGSTSADSLRVQIQK